MKKEIIEFYIEYIFAFFRKTNSKKGQGLFLEQWSHLNLLRKYKMGDFCIFVLPQTISYKSPICTKYSAKIQ